MIIYMFTTLEYVSSLGKELHTPPDLPNVEQKAVGENYYYKVY